MTDSVAQTPQNHALIVAAGRGERSGLGLPKQYALIRGLPMVRHSAVKFLEHPDISKLWVVIQAGQEDQLLDALEELNNYEIVMGGATRQDSVKNGLSAIAAAGGAKNVLIHDAARPFLSQMMIDRLLASLEHESGVIPVLPVVDTTINIIDRYLEQALDRDALWRVQTPQAFNFNKLLKAHDLSSAEFDATDDAQIFKAAGNQVAIVEGDEALKKYTTAADFDQLSEKNMIQIRTGTGFDVHQLAAGEELWLGGLKIAHDKGLAGHSDADVLLHALTDALLGAAGAGDIGDHFPPSDPKWRGASSDKFVEFAVSVIKQKGGAINNVDMTVICEAPKIKPHREAMRQNIANMLGLPTEQVSVKATTTEQLGFTGRGEGIAAQAVATISME
ncbi:bifunctional 2-C-methyl-D-erythritol 4-phosphate cytidylyltransferase/2-C-methyl-D-erythritol 2,4-cyclodiphosphate synthase [Parasphingorhabdus cellanae]|uniref:Bifunctional enzyme IspD/IspF n=1 Tax=Parasphingorhabdus cellanae TaxID=2806553 RepID=A0ABX7T610_9SPHN|nr:bifunctional 2-C-methyl-D-erythritol 4-phosphate cytidylyltransferase/2-C-methyl-D-erythritol 2,4-cyclodiphosphate synthase [Parasphingorhabdus cellanae]QTD56212.1 bifunctional 2-C-methyl-D-erythritol 4-phosphate cytidylyltransferase/2-C-methyl-D-erythritol 2,4-cyclodiphosphate synthase [Parasphingorhabdus cellanae]